MAAIKLTTGVVCDKRYEFAIAICPRQSVRQSILVLNDAYLIPSLIFAVYGSRPPVAEKFRLMITVQHIRVQVGVERPVIKSSITRAIAERV